MARRVQLKDYGQPGWHYGDMVRITKGRGMDEFAGKIGRVIAAEGEYLRIEFDTPVMVKGVGMVRDDLWMPYTLRKLRNPIGDERTKTKQVKYRGHFISGGKGFYWSYAAGQDISGKTISEVKDKIHRLEYGGLPRLLRNPGAAYHEDHAKYYNDVSGRRYGQLLNEAGSFYAGLASRESTNAAESRRLGMLNPIRKHRTKKFNILPLLAVGGILWYLISRNKGSA